MYKIIRLFIPLFTLLSLSSCALLLGVDKHPDWQSNEEAIKQAEKRGIHAEYNLMLDTIKYNKELISLYKTISEQIKGDSSSYKLQKEVIKDDSQPVQFRLFDAKGNEVFKIVNCYVEKPILADWNVNGCLDTFPPYINIESLNIHNFNLDFLLNCTQNLDGKDQLKLQTLPKADYYGVIVWNDMYRKYSNKLIKIVREKVAKTDKSVILIYNMEFCGQ